MPQRIFGTCQVTGCARAHKARGYCATHYAQHLRCVPIVAEIRARDSSPPLECTEQGCSGAVVGRGLCQMHYARLLRHGHTRYRDRKKAPKTCSATGCDSHVYAKGVCHQHYMRAKHVKARFGMTMPQLEKLEASQGGLCAICRSARTRANWRSGKKEAMRVDHDHKTGAVRGLLCDHCNRGIGMLGDDPATLRAAAAYIERHAAEAVRTPAPDGSSRDYMVLVPMPAEWPPAGMLAGLLN